MSDFKERERREDYSKGPTLRFDLMPSKQQPLSSLIQVSLIVLCLTQGTISVGIDATDLFDRYEEDYEEISVGSGGGLPHIEINRMHISQSIEVQSLHHVFSDVYSHWYITVQKYGLVRFLFLLKDINTCIQKGCIELKRKKICNVTKDVYFT